MEGGGGSWTIYTLAEGAKKIVKFDLKRNCMP